MRNVSPKETVMLAGSASGSSTWVDVRGYENLTFYVSTNGNPDPGGTLILEETYLPPGVGAGGLFPRSNADPAVAQTASQIASIDIDATVGTNGVYAYHVGGPGGSFAYAYVRARISVAVVTATIDVVLVAC